MCSTGNVCMIHPETRAPDLKPIKIQKNKHVEQENTIRITNAEGHADDEMVQLGAVKQVDKDCADRAVEAADLGRRHVGGAHIMDVRRTFSQARHFWYLVIRYLHRFFHVRRLYHR